MGLLSPDLHLAGSGCRGRSHHCILNERLIAVVLCSIDMHRLMLCYEPLTHVVVGLLR
jgi:hypothetical protein